MLMRFFIEANIWYAEPRRKESSRRQDMEINSGDLERRLVDLETKHSFQEASILDLSAVIVSQAARIDALESVVRGLRDKVKDLVGEGQEPLPPNERPPHY
jgi:SlyX protein